MPRAISAVSPARSLVTQLAVIAAPALLMTLMLTSSPRQTLLLRWPPWLAIPAAALLAVVLHPAANVLQIGRAAALPGERKRPARVGEDAGDVPPGRLLAAGAA